MEGAIQVGVRAGLFQIEAQRPVFRSDDVMEGTVDSTVSHFTWPPDKTLFGTQRHSQRNVLGLYYVPTYLSTHLRNNDRIIVQCTTPALVLLLLQAAAGRYWTGVIFGRFHGAFPRLTYRTHDLHSGIGVGPPAAQACKNLQEPARCSSGPLARCRPHV